MDKNPSNSDGFFHRISSQYEQMVMQNHEKLNTFDSIMRAAAYFLPSGYFGDAEIQYEGGVIVNLVSFINDLILVKYFIVNPRFHEALSRKIPPPDSILFSAAKVLTTINYTELFLEMIAAKQWKEKGRWTVIITIETLRACIRLFVLIHTGGCMLVQQTIPQRDTLLSKTRGGPLRRTTPTATRLLADLIYIFRPLIYVYALWRMGKQSWRPWLLALGLDVLSRILIGRTANLSDQERDEIARRTAQWGWAVLRAPCFDVLLRTEQLQFFGGLGNLPLLGSLFRSLLDYIQRYRQHYFYTAASS